jgi:tRNA A37 threonylcarbamoyladenosine biosynthesis protein TsaE
LDELIADERNVVLIEWGEKFARLVRERDVEIAIDRTGPDSRKFTIHDS